MATRRSYNDMCGMAHALDLVGERWALLVVRELLLGPKRYSDLRADLPGISTNVLSQRLSDLEREGVVRRAKLPPPAASAVYQLTEWGQELEPVVCALGRWGFRSPSWRPGTNLSTSALILSLRTNVRDTAGEPAMRVGLRIGEHTFRAEVANGTFTVVPATANEPDVVLEADEPRSLAVLVYGAGELDTAVAEGTVRFSGDRDVALRFVSLFALPETAAPSAAVNG
ncbi:putative transcriptional regulator [Saccharomonospora marina XMU15]|uniref:Putative transcriptional regulator n=1 Tax=Saccharomonospora marina XMU15 TaxID=882083 RepID=H5WYY3_9PSEU|nr:helix-turn-helix domain-containing protein [Saccharomonospora marina]EHR51855.1 putative transcriptional regulator [Saccharomonospora marina XMU15]